jgi:hypothetical protein
LHKKIVQVGTFVQPENNSHNIWDEFGYSMDIVLVVEPHCMPPGNLKLEELIAKNYYTCPKIHVS